MNLDQQLQLIIDQAPQYGISAQIMEQGVIPVLKAIANRLQKLEYYILQNADQDWLLTILQNRDNPEYQKKVIYAFATLEDAVKSQAIIDNNAKAIKLSVSDLLFQLISLEELDSMIFLNTPGDGINGIEIEQVKLKNLISMQIQQVPKIPPNIA